MQNLKHKLKSIKFACFSLENLLIAMLFIAFPALIRQILKLFSSYSKFCIGFLFFLIVSCDDSGKEKSVTELPYQTTFKVEDFSPAADCQTCHPVYFEEWAASMHAYSMSDPIWFALQRSSQTAHKAVGEELGDFCVQCHSPIAALTDAITDHENFTISVSNTLPQQIQDGVTCDVCHTITHLPESTDIQTDDQAYETADFKLYTDGTRYGTLEDPQENTFHKSAFHAGYDQSEYCRNCHNLTVNGVDAEVTNSEWERSAFKAMGTECQTCHMPLYEGYAAEGGPLRKNLHRHYFPGVGTSILEDSQNELLIPAIAELLNGSAEVNFFESLPDTINLSEQLSIKLIVTNNAGHNFPSGVPFTRQLWLEVFATVDGDTIFKSGYLDENGDIYDFHTDPDNAFDPQLNVFQTVLYNDEGDSAVSVENMTWMNDNTLPVSGSKIVNYLLDLPTIVPGGGSEITISIRLLFRALPPYLLRKLSLYDELERLIIWEIDTSTASAVLE